MIIALCLNSVEIEDLLKLQPGEEMAHWERYPGSGWVTSLRDRSDLNVVSSQEAINLLSSGKIECKEILTIQEEGNSKLVDMGCVPWINFCLESPLYTRQFYAHINSFRDKFIHSFHFDWRETKDIKTHPVYFPSFDESQIMPPEPIKDRNLLTCIMSNKFISTDDVRSLHPERIKVLSDFLKRPGFSLYGRGWGNNLIQDCRLKTPILRSHKFTLCYENYSMPGYITEKIIHGILCGSVPVYVGAPDIGDYIPFECFVDGRVSTPELLWDHLNSMSNEQIKSKIEAGQKWLRSSGLAYSYGAFAKRLLDLLP